MRSIIVTAAALASACGAAVAAPIVGVAGYSAFGTQALYAFDQTTGQATLIGDTGLSQINGLAWNPASGILYATTSGSDLYRINQYTAKATLIADAFGITPAGGLTFDNAGNLWATNANQFGTINLATGAFTGISTLQSPATDLSGLAFDAATGSLAVYAKNGAADDRLMIVDPATGIVSFSDPYAFAGPGSVGGLDVDPITGIAALTDGASLFLSNPGTFDFNPNAPLFTGVSGISGLAFIPSPGTAALLALGALVATRRRTTNA
ncbi:MAG: hypothetical protein ACTS3F_04655 [Phycisphaerales bacterium]